MRLILVGQHTGKWLIELSTEAIMAMPTSYKRDRGMAIGAVIGGIIGGVIGGWGGGLGGAIGGAVIGAVVGAIVGWLSSLF